MNERIKELAAVAEQYTNDTVAHLERVHNRDFSFDEIDDMYNTKFAELIVRECGNYMNSRIPGNLEVSATVVKMKQHLGVKE